MRKARNSGAASRAAAARLIPRERWPQSDLRIGISGWNYAGWRGVYYPKGLPQKEELEFASRTFSSIEIKGSFYSLQRPSSYAEWYRRTPANFVFSVKGPRFITHMKIARCACAADEFLRLGAADAAGEAGAGAVAVSSELRLE